MHLLNKAYFIRYLPHKCGFLNLRKVYKFTIIEVIWGYTYYSNDTISDAKTIYTSSYDNLKTKEKIIQVFSNKEEALVALENFKLNEYIICTKGMKEILEM